MGEIYQRLCTICMSRKNNSWCKEQQDVGPSSDKMGNDRKQLLLCKEQKKPTSQNRMFENLQMPSCSHISIPLFMAHLKAFLYTMKTQRISIFIMARSFQRNFNSVCAQNGKHRWNFYINTFILAPYLIKLMNVNLKHNCFVHFYIFMQHLLVTSCNTSKGKTM